MAVKEERLQKISSDAVPLTPRSHFLKTLDGWRAIAILAVIAHHDSLHYGAGFVYEYGFYGVDIFFAISGILICTRLLMEEQESGRISLSSFYARRAFRILPPALVYLGVISLLSRTGVLVVSWREVVSSLLFCRNYPSIFHVAAGWYTGHFWTLSLEEQFYWILPIVLIVTPKRLRWLVLVIFSTIITMKRIAVINAGLWIPLHFHAEVRLDAMLVPALFAVVAFTDQGKDLLRRGLWLWPLYALLTIAVIALGHDTTWGETTIVWLMPCIVLGSVLNTDNVFARFLELKWLKAVGLISYSLYLWQQLFFVGHFVRGKPLGALQTWPLCAVCTFGAATASYWLVEKPFTNLGRQILSRHKEKSPAI